MNSFHLNYTRNVGARGSVTDFLAAVTIGSILSPNFKVVRETIADDAVTSFLFDLPFALTNLSMEPVAYDTRFQSVKEFIDKPYAVAGRVVALLHDTEANNAYDVKKDFDDFIKYPNIVSLNEGSQILDLYIGIVNSTLTETYAPFGAINGNMGIGITAMKIFDTKDLVKALAQSACSKAGSLSGVSMTASLPNYQSPPFNPNSVSVANKSLTATLIR